MNSTKRPWWALAQVLVAAASLTRPQPAMAGIDLRYAYAPAIEAVGGSPIAAAWGDYDGDGNPDLAVATGVGVRLIRNMGGGSFQNYTHKLPGAMDGAYAMGVTWVDVDNDGDLDLFVTCWLTGHLLYLNNGDGTFTLELRTAALPPPSRGMSVAWADLDNDGWLDFVMANGGGAAVEPFGVYRGGAGRIFAKVQSGMLPFVATQGAGVAIGDFNEDLLPDVVTISISNGGNALYANRGGGVLVTNVPDPFKSVAMPHLGSSAAWGDYDNDGHLDLFATRGGGLNGLAHNNGLGVLVPVPDAAPVLTAEGQTVGVVWADFDNDGLLDLLISNRGGAPYLYRNLGGGLFEQVLYQGIAIESYGSNGIAVGDYNGDGALDVAMVNWPSGSIALFQNHNTTNHWLRVRLEGSPSNSHGIGARVKVTATIGGRSVTQVRQIGGEDSWGSQEPLAHFGLGDATFLESLAVEWPSGAKALLGRVEANQVLTLSEQRFADLQVVPLGGVYPGEATVRLTTSLADAQIRYTLDGSAPTATSPQYLAPLHLTNKTQVQALVFRGDTALSRLAKENYVIDGGLTFTPPEAVFTNSVRVTLASQLPEAIIHYSIDGTEPQLNSPIYVGPVQVADNVTLRARSFVGGQPSSVVFSGLFRRVYVLDNDGIPADWRQKYFGNDYRFDPWAASDADPDFDGATNLQEFLIHTDPRDAKSGMRTSIRLLPEIAFETVVGVKYRVMRCNALTGVRVQVTELMTGTGAVMKYTDFSEGGPAVFYVVEPVP